MSNWRKTMKSTPKIAKKGAGRKWAEKLKKLGDLPPPQGLIDAFIKNHQKKVASPSQENSKEISN